MMNTIMLHFHAFFVPLILGHSLGGGVAAVVAYLLSNQYPTVISQTETPRHRAVLFAPARVGGEDFMAALANKVVVRSIVTDYDPVPLIPCDKSLECPANFVPHAEEAAAAPLSFAGYPGAIWVSIELSNSSDEYINKVLSNLQFLFVDRRETSHFILR